MWIDSFFFAIYRNDFWAGQDDKEIHAVNQFS